jgi:hypothetical protein
MGSYRILPGDATKPQILDNAKGIMIPHVCNNIGGWGSGFVLAINEAFGNKAMNAYRRWHSNGNFDMDLRADDDFGYSDTAFVLGSVQYVRIDKPKYLGRPVTIANMIGQHKTIPHEAKPIRYAALATAMDEVGITSHANNSNYEIHAPMFGSGLAGGNWEIIKSLIHEIWVDKYDLDVTIYEFEQSKE